MKPVVLLMACAVTLSACNSSNENENTDSSNDNEALVSTESPEVVKKVTGIGGIFFKTENPSRMREWYSKNLGLVTDQYGALFEFRSTDEPSQKNYLQWSPFSKTTTYFEPSEKEFMINYRVGNLSELLEELQKNGVEIVDTIETYDYGNFVHIMDPDSNKIELWEPVDSVFTNLYDGKTAH